MADLGQCEAIRMPFQRNRRIIFASTIGFIQRSVQLIAGFIAVPLVMQDLGISGFGIWGAATSLVWLSSVLDLGLGNALVNVLPKALVDGDTRSAREYVCATLVASSALSIVIMLFGSMLVFHSSRDEETISLLIAVMGLALNVPLSIASNGWYGMHQGAKAAAWDIGQTVLMLVLLFTAIAMHANVEWMVAAVYGAFVFSNAGSLIHLLSSNPCIRPEKWRCSFAESRDVFRQGGTFFLITAAVSCSYLLDNFIALHFLGSDASAQITVALRLCTTVSGIIGVLTQPLWAAFVEAGSAGDTGWTKRVLVLGTVGVMTATVAGAAILLAFGQDLLRLWLHRDINFDAHLIFAVCAWIIALCVPRVATLYLNTVSALRLQLRVALAVALISFLLKYLLIDRYGVSGILGSTPMGWLLLAWPVYFWVIYHRVKA